MFTAWEGAREKHDNPRTILFISFLTHQFIVLIIATEMESSLMIVLTLIDIGALQTLCMHYSIQNPQQLAVVCLQYVFTYCRIVPSRPTLNEQLTDTCYVEVAPGCRYPARSPNVRPHAELQQQRTFMLHACQIKNRASHDVSLDITSKSCKDMR